MNSPPLPDFATTYLDRFARSWTERTPARQVRFVVLDTETTGLDPRRDRLITVGAVAVKAGEIILGDSFEAMLKVAYNSSSVTVHGITREEARDGMDEPEAIKWFLNYLGDAVIVGHHIGHDVATLNAAYERHYGFTLKNRSLDTMDLTLNLQRDGAFAGDGVRGFSLDALCEFFDVSPHDRHTAGGDAFITALIFLKLLRIAERSGRATLEALSEPYSPEAGDEA
jgi:DNA polymerase-3 subunit epsilon